MRFLILLLFLGSLFSHTGREPYYSKEYFYYYAYKYLTFVNGYVEVHVFDKYPDIDSKGWGKTNVWVYHAAMAPYDGGDWDGPYSIWKINRRAFLRSKPDRKSKAVGIIYPNKHVYIINMGKWPKGLF